MRAEVVAHGSCIAAIAAVWWVGGEGGWVGFGAAWGGQGEVVGGRAQEALE